MRFFAVPQKISTGISKPVLYTEETHHCCCIEASLHNLFALCPFTPFPHRCLLTAAGIYVNRTSPHATHHLLTLTPSSYPFPSSLHPNPQPIGSFSVKRIERHDLASKNIGFGWSFRIGIRACAQVRSDAIFNHFFFFYIIVFNLFL